MHENPEYWDEYDWENYLKLQERRRETLLLYAFRSVNPWRAVNMWLELQSALLPDEEEEFWYYKSDGEDWKIATNYCFRYVSDVMSTIRTSLTKLSERGRGGTAVVELIAISHSIPTLIAIGLLLDSEYRSPGGTIAYCKRALSMANEALSFVKELGSDRVVSAQEYRVLIRDWTAIRNTVGCYISDLRQETRKKS